MVGNILAGAVGGATVSIFIKAIDQFSGTFSKVNMGMVALGGAITGIGLAGLGAVAGITKIAGEFEKTRIAFTTMLGSGEEADKLLKDLAKFAAKTPFTIPGIEANAKQLLAMGIETDKLLPTLKSLGDVSAGLNVPIDRLALNLGQVKTQGKLTGRELRDFAVAGVPLIAELAKNLGVSKKEIAKMVSAGDIGFAEVENAFKTMTSEGGKFFNLMDAQSETFLGQVSNIQDSLIRIARVMGEIFLPAAKFLAKTLQILISFFEEHPTLAKFAAIVLAVGTAIALIAGPILILIGFLPMLIAGFGALSAVTLPITGTVLLIAAAIAALIAIGTLLFLNWDKLGKKTKILLGFLFPMIVIPIAIIKNWDFLKVKIAEIWNSIVSFVEIGVNKLIGFINKLISAFNSISGKLGFGEIGKISDVSFSGGNVDVNALQSSISRGRRDQFRGTTVNIENVNGMNPEDVSRALSDELSNKISL